jgi:N-acetylglucosaminyl-diphospho-decaprenol L-rhamnosyltransferase
MSASIHVVIVNWNTGRYLEDCLRSLEAASVGPHTVLRVTVVDNASEDGSADGLEDLRLPLEILRNSRNTGFAAACNQGAAGSEADYLLFLNPDTRVRLDTLVTVAAFMEGEKAADVGICGVRLVDGTGAPAISCARFPTLRIFVGKMTGLDRALPRVFPPHHLEPAETRASRPVDQVIGAFFLVRRDLFVRLGGFNEVYFLYFEEVDLALRARQAGWRSFLLTEASAVHAENVSSNQVRDVRLYHSLRSRLLFVHRHWPRRHGIACLVLMLSVEPVARLAQAARRGDSEELAGTAAAYRRLLRDLPRIRRATTGASQSAP